jgi:MOSC domain-containing protein YiiM
MREKRLRDRNIERSEPRGTPNTGGAGSPLTATGERGWRRMLVGRLCSVQVGRPAPLLWRGKTIESAIVKHPVDGAVHLGFQGFEGDEQADLRVHGGLDKAACAYPVEHRSRWERELGRKLPAGAFGENLAVAGLLEEHVCVGDIFALGDTVVQVSQPRGPCYKLAARWGHKTLPDLMAKAGISGFYLRVLEEGEVRAGDELRLIERRALVTVGEVMRVTYRDRRHRTGLAAAAAVPELAAQWRVNLEQMLRRRA